VACSRCYSRTGGESGAPPPLPGPFADAEYRIGINLRAFVLRIKHSNPRRSPPSSSFVKRKSLFVAVPFRPLR
jgi:hypothetical protein